MQSQQDLAALLAAHRGLRVEPAAARYAGAGQQPIIVIERAGFSAALALQGAQLLECTVSGQPLLWLSPRAVFDGRSPIRGGIPLCLPWFGVNRRRPDLPKHGVARNMTWTLTGVEADAGALQLTLSHRFEASAAFPYRYRAELCWQLSAQGIAAELRVENLSAQAFVFSAALHSYLAVASLSAAAIDGLDGATYLDNTAALAARHQRGALRFAAEVDRVFCGRESGVQRLASDGAALQISAQQLPTVIVWNPGPAAAGIADIGPHYNEFVCVERGAAFADEVSLAAGASWRARMTIAPV